MRLCVHVWLASYSICGHQLKFCTSNSLSTSDVITAKFMAFPSFISPPPEGIHCSGFTYSLTTWCLAMQTSAGFIWTLTGRETRKWTRHWGWDSTQTINKCWPATRKGVFCRAYVIVHTHAQKRLIKEISLIVKEMWAAMRAEIMQQLLLNQPKREITARVDD